MSTYVAWYYYYFLLRITFVIGENKRLSTLDRYAAMCVAGARHLPQVRLHLLEPAGRITARVLPWAAVR